VTSIADVSIINDPSLDQHDTLDIGDALFSKLFPKEEINSTTETVNNKYVLVKLLGAPDYFNKFRIMKLNSNLVNFNNDSLTLNKAVIKSIDYDDIPKLSQIFVSIPHEIYQLLHEKSQQAIKQKFLTQLLVDNGNVVNEGDSIRLINGTVNLCEPLTQGRVEYDTNIVLINQNEDKYNEQESIDIENERDLESDQDENLDLSSYLSSSLQFDKFDQYTKPENSNRFKVGPLPQKFNIDDLPLNWKKDDSELFVFINNADFIKLGFPIFNGDLVKIKTGTETETETVVVRVFTFTEPQNSFKTGTVYMSPILLINLKLQKDSYIEFEPVTQLDTLSNTIPIAESVTISRVSSQITMDKTYQQSFFSSLKTTLSTRLKCVKQGDYLPVVIDTVLAKTMFDNLIEDGNENEETSGSNEGGIDVSGNKWDCLFIFQQILQR